MDNKTLTAAQLRDLLSYDKSTGNFTWLVGRRRVKAGSIAGCLRGDGYRSIRVIGRSYSAHRLAWLHVYGEWPQQLVDHIDGNKGNNAISNLRDASRNINAQNQKKAPRNNKSTGLIGVSKNVRNKTNPYVARVTNSEGKKVHIGFFPTAELAHAAYVNAKRIMQPGCTL